MEESSIDFLLQSFLQFLHFRKNVERFIYKSIVSFLQRGQLNIPSEVNFIKPFPPDLDCPLNIVYIKSPLTTESN
jgi:hypothetical protein